MSQRSQRLRALVTERLTAAAEEIFVLVERTIAEYEEELCRSKEENQRKQQLLDSALGPQLLLHRTDAQSHWSPESGLKQENPETPQIKEEQTDDSSVTDGDDDWEPAASTSAAQTETEADGDHYNQVQIRDTRPALFTKDTSAAETGAAVTDGHTSGSAAGKRREHQCTFCNKRFPRKRNLTLHTKLHTGETPFMCSACGKVFSQNCHLRVHMRTHTGEKPFTCAVCKKTFNQKISLDVHMRRHTGEKPYICPLCDKTFSQKCNLSVHMRTHTGEKPYSCLVCKKAFNQKNFLNVHMRTHTGERPYTCAVCEKGFNQRGTLNKHMRSHRAEPV